MSPTDPRHGTRAGYQAHRKAGQDACPACLRGRGRADKRARVASQLGEQMTYTPDEVAAVINPWLAMGITHTAICTAAGLGRTHGSRFAEQVAGDGFIRRSAYRALTALTEDSFTGSALVYADLTRTRVFSLRAAGHTLRSMPICDTGKWRYRTNVTIAQARLIRDHYARVQETSSLDLNSQSRARHDGHRTPAAWEDPGTLAWPLGWTEPIETTRAVDEVVVERILAGDWHLFSTPAEKAEVVARWRGKGRSVYSLEQLTGWNARRYYDLDDSAVA